MFYNTYRSTKAAMREAQQNKLSGAGQYIVNPHERLINLQKREKNPLPYLSFDRNCCDSRMGWLIIKR